MVESYSFWWNEAKRISKYSNPSGGYLWLDPLTIFSQWAQETAYFTSNNLKTRNNLAGMTWYSGYKGIGRKGGARPKNEGGYYIDYSHLGRENAAMSYVEFVQRSGKTGRYKFANIEPTYRRKVDDEFVLFANAGWAADKGYANKLKSVKNSIVKRGLIDEKDLGLSALGASGVNSSSEFSYSSSGVKSKVQEEERENFIDQLYSLEKGVNESEETGILGYVEKKGTMLAFRTVFIVVGLIVFVVALINLLKGNSGGMLSLPRTSETPTPTLQPE